MLVKTCINNYSLPSSTPKSNTKAHKSTKKAHRKAHKKHTKAQKKNHNHPISWLTIIGLLQA